MASQIVKRGIQTAALNLSSQAGAAGGSHGGKFIFNIDCIMKNFVFHSKNC